MMFVTSNASAAPSPAVVTSLSPRDPAALLDRLASGVAVAAVDGLAIRWANAAFLAWFPECRERPSAGLIGIDRDRLARDLGRRGRHVASLERSVGGRGVALEVTIVPVGDASLLVEVRNDDRARKAELMLESYSRLAEKNLRELALEKGRVERLLLNLMPRAVLAELREFGTVSPQRFDSTTALMLDFVDFSEMAVARDPAALVAELNDIFSAFDRISEMFACERIKTNGDSYMAVCGLPEPCVEHAAHMAHAALRMRGYIDRRNRSNGNQWRCRIGIASGPVVGSIVGINKYVYDVFGPAVTLAARLEKVALPMQIIVDDATTGLLGSSFACEPRKPCRLKGFGRQSVFELLGPKA